MVFWEEEKNLGVGSVELDLPGHLLVKAARKASWSLFSETENVWFYFIFSFHHLLLLCLPSFLLLPHTLKNLMGRCPTTNSHLKLQSLQVKTCQHALRVMFGLKATLVRRCEARWFQELTLIDTSHDTVLGSWQRGRKEEWIPWGTARGSTGLWWHSVRDHWQHLITPPPHLLTLLLSGQRSSIFRRLLHCLLGRAHSTKKKIAQVREYVSRGRRKIRSLSLWNEKPKSLEGQRSHQGFEKVAFWAGSAQVDMVSASLKSVTILRRKGK